MTSDVAERALPIGELSRDQLKLVKRTVAAGATDDELRLFMHDCQRRGVHPLDRLLHFTKRGGKYTPITSIDFMRSRAAETGEYAGNEDPLFKYADPDAAHPTGATVTVWRLVQGQRCGFTATARWSEYYPGETLGFMWKKLPHVMLGKVAEALALRKGFPHQLAGLYETSEMDQAKDGAGTERMPTPSPAEIEAERAQIANVVDKSPERQALLAQASHAWQTSPVVAARFASEHKLPNAISRWTNENLESFRDHMKASAE